MTRRFIFAPLFLLTFAACEAEDPVPPEGDGGDEVECLLNGDCLEGAICRAGRCVVPEPPGEYGAWSQWSTCDTGCGLGFRNRTRPCSFGGAEVDCARCGGACEESESCESTTTCSYAHGAWSYFSDCSVTCGGGMESRTRPCLRGDGAEVECSHCAGGCTESRACNDVPSCSYHYGIWGEPEGCSNRCGEGVKTRRRACLSDGGGTAECSQCGGACADSVSCTSFAGCSYEYTEWSDFSPCSASCGEGTRSRERRCVRSDGERADCEYCGGACEETVECTGESGCVDSPPDSWTFSVSSTYSNYSGHQGTQTRSGGGLADSTTTGSSSVWGSNSGAGQYIQADFGGVVLVGYILVAPISVAFDGWGPSYLSGTAIEYSSDGANWTLAGNVPTVVDGQVTEIAVSFSARYVRLYRSGYLGVGEFSFR